MTVKERFASAVRMKAIDRLPFWPKLDKAYTNRWGRSGKEWHAFLGTDRTEGIGRTYRELRKKTGYEDIVKGSEMINVYRTPYGELRQAQRFDEASQSWHPTEYPVHTRDDLRKMTSWFADDGIEFDKDAYKTAKARYAEIGEDAYATCAIGHSALQHFVERLAGIEEAHYLMADYPDEVNELFAAIHEFNLKRIRCEAEHSPADSLMLVENTSTTTISPAQYESLCFSHVNEYCGIAKAADKDIMLHMCGHLKQLLPWLSLLPASSFEAFTAPTVGNTTLLDGRNACPRVCLIGGTNAAIWLLPAEKIIEYLEEQLGALPHHQGIVVTSGGVMPPACEPETIRFVKQWLDAYPANFG